MLFAKPYYPVIINFGLHNFSIAVIEKANGVPTLKSLKQCAATDLEKQNELILESKNSLGIKAKFLRATCHVTPEARLVRRVDIDGAKHADTNYLSEIASSQLKIDPNQYDLAVLDAVSGLPISNTTKSAVFAGLPTTIAVEIQSQLVSRDIFPERIGLSSINEIGAYHSLLKQDSSGTPTLLLEIGTDSCNAYIISKEGLEATKTITQGIDSMIPVIIKDLGLKDEDSARKLLQSNAFDFTSMSAALTKRLVKELQSSIGFFEVQTGLSISQMCCIGLPDKMGWLESSIESQLGLKQLNLSLDKAQSISKIKPSIERTENNNLKEFLSASAAFES